MNNPQYLDSGILIEVGNLIGIKQVGQDGKLIEEIIYRITEVVVHPATTMTKEYFVVKLKHPGITGGNDCTGWYEDVTIGKGELEEMYESRQATLYYRA